MISCGRAELVGRRILTNTYRTSLLSSHYLIPKTVQAASCSNLQLATGPFSPGAFGLALVSMLGVGGMLGLRSESAMWKSFSLNLWLLNHWLGPLLRILNGHRVRLWGSKGEGVSCRLRGSCELK